MEARRQNYDAVMTLDEDFNKLLLEHDSPPKVIWLKTGNCSTLQLANIIILHHEMITDFLSKTSNFDCLEIYG
jgi:predicted nuclease of predicted toxin-antitoxin system